MRSLRTYTLDDPGAHEQVAEMETGAWRDVIRLHKERSGLTLMSEFYGGEYADIPYAPLHTQGSSVFGDYTNVQGQNEFLEAKLSISQDGFMPPPWAADLWRFSALKQARSFTRDDEVACLRGFDIVDGKPRFVVGPGKYSEGFHSMGSEGVRISLNDAEKAALADSYRGTDALAELLDLHTRLHSEYGEVTLREAVLQRTDGKLPPYGDQVYSATLGVAGTVLTADNEYIFVRRGASVSINRGINVTASGAPDFDRDSLSRDGMAQFLGREMARETEEETGLRSGTLLLGAMKKKIQVELGVEDESRYDLIPVGFARELPRGGSPEAMFLIRYKGGTEDLVRTIMNNEHEGRLEIDSHVYAMPHANALELLKHPDGANVVHHKAALNLLLIHEWLKNNA